MAIATVNPMTGRVERKFVAHSAEEVERLLSRAADAASLLRTTSFRERSSWMLQASRNLEARTEHVAATISTEMGKPIAQARTEIVKSVATMRYYALHAEEILSPVPLQSPGDVGATEAFAQYEPLGVVLAVMPWNYPIWQVVRFAAPALMAGNAGLLKHASNVPQSALLLNDLFTGTGFPEGSLGTLLVGAPSVDKIVADPRVMAVTLTGSEGAGRLVGAAAGRELKKAVLELGGSDPFIVMPSADIDRAAQVGVEARMANTGQSCIAAKRFLIHTDVYERFSESFASQVAGLKVGDPLLEETQIGPLATAWGRDELAELVDDAIRHGATVRVQGSQQEGKGWFYPPTVLEGVTSACRLYHEEAFGPVAVLYRVEDEVEARRIANGTRFGLSSSVWTADYEQADRFIRGLDVGAVFVNGMSASYPELPFGGVKASGFGRELGWAGIQEFCNLKTVWVGDSHSTRTCGA